MIKSAALRFTISAFCLTGTLGAEKKGAGDHLVFAAPESGLSLDYEKLCQRKLFVSRGAPVARFLYKPGTFGTESAVSVDEHTGLGGEASYRVTITQAATPLWDFIQDTKYGSSGRPSPVKIKRCDCVLPSFTAVAVREAWMEMLAKSQPEKETGIPFDVSQETFSATYPNGRVISAKAPINAPKGGDVDDLMDLANRLIEYCSGEKSLQPTRAAQIEKASRHLIEKVRDRQLKGRLTSRPK